MQSASVWRSIAQDKELTKKQMIQSFILDCAHYAKENAAIPLHEKNNKYVRIATYNVHSWHDPHAKSNILGIMQVIANMNADVLILQEVSLFDADLIRYLLQVMGGYTYGSFVKAANHGGNPFGNMIISKYPFVKPPVLKTFEADKENASTHFEKRGYIAATIQLPGKKQITVYGTHLDVYDETEWLRLQEVQELHDAIASEEGPCVIAADCNAVRSCDYAYCLRGKVVWDMLSERHIKRTGTEISTYALDLLELYGYVDCFTKNNQLCPKFTAWSGTTVDFIWLNKSFDLPISGCYTWYSAASDHLPIIMDVKIV